MAAVIPNAAQRKAEVEALLAKQQVGRKMLRQQQAREHLLPFTQTTMPNPTTPDDVNGTLYTAREHHRYLMNIMERVASGELLRVIISCPPQTGKSEIVTRRFMSWMIGKFPWLQLIMGTYSQDFADDKGGEVRETLESDEFKGIFPACRLQTGSRAKKRMVTTAGGGLRFVGRGGAATGRPANGWILDDILKNDVEADSPTIREQAWQWFTKVCFSRLQATTFVVIMATRWHDDDVIGRLTDTANPCYDAEEAKNWLVINIPAELDAFWAAEFGRTEGEALWPERQPLTLLASAKRLNPRGYQALYLGKPAPDEGDYFKREWLVGYTMDQLPKYLRVYGASDHALTEAQENDANVIGSFGVDANDEIWIFPDLAWGRWETDVTVEELINQFQAHRPQLWFAEDEHIRKAIGPFLRKRMRETKTYTTIAPIRPTRSKTARARSIQGRLQMKMVHFPREAGWWPDAQHELLRFPRGIHDDFVDFLALVGLGLDTMAAATEPTANDNAKNKPGTLAHLKEQTRLAERRPMVGNLPGGW